MGAVVPPDSDPGWLDLGGSPKATWLEEAVRCGDSALPKSFQLQPGPQGPTPHTWTGGQPGRPWTRGHGASLSPGGHTAVSDDCATAL